jgi:RNA polymerase sigma-70 factor (ECF subfamily)
VAEQKMAGGKGSQRIAEWMRRWNSGLTRFLERRVATPIDAQDLAQEVYLRLLRLEQIDLIAEPQAYLYRVASNVATEWRMRASQRKPHSADELDVLVDLASPEVLVDEALSAARLDAALRELTPVVRAVMYLKLRDSMTHEQIARHLSVTSRMVRRYLTVGYTELRRRLYSE